MTTSRFDRAAVIDVPDCYDYPAYYELAFDFRDLDAEAGVIARLMADYSGLAGRDILHLACGPAQHMAPLHQQGFAYSGLDLNPAMIAHARDRAASLGIPARFHQASMIDFAVPERFDMVFIALGDLYARGAADLDRHLDAVAAALRPGGLFLLDWCVQFEPEKVFDAAGQTWRMERDGVIIDAAVRMMPVSPSDQTFDEVLELSIDDHGRMSDMRSVERKYAVYPQQFLRLVDMHPALEFVGWWNNWDTAQPITAQSREIYRPIALLRHLAAN